MSTKLSDEKIEAIRKRKAEGAGFKELTKEFNCSKATISWYVRDLTVPSPLRKYGCLAERTETVRAKYKHLCIDCKKPIDKEHIRCQDCYRKSRGIVSIAQPKLKTKESDEKIKKSIEPQPEMERKKQFDSICKLSPTNEHIYVLHGICKYCWKREE